MLRATQWVLTECGSTWYKISNFKLLIFHLNFIWTIGFEINDFKSFELINWQIEFAKFSWNRRNFSSWKSRFTLLDEDAFSLKFLIENRMHFVQIYFKWFRTFQFADERYLFIIESRKFREFRNRDSQFGEFQTLLMCEQSSTF